ncbi:MAG TPA: hypothetical protein PK263_05055 [bacterium]|nr:hypothetical protein [bacterium]
MAKDENIDNPKPLLEWKAAESVSSERNVSWYVIVIAAALVIGYFLYRDSNWTGLVLVIIGMLLILASRMGQHEVSCSVFDKGIVVDNKVYEYTDFKNFFFSVGELSKLKLQRAGRWAGQVTVPVTDEISEKARTLLSKHLPEEKETGEDFVDRINRLFRF